MLNAQGKYLQDTFGLDIHGDMQLSGSLLADAEKSQREEKLIFGVNVLSGNLGKSRTFGLQMREDFCTMSVSTRCSHVKESPTALE